MKGKIKNVLNYKKPRFWVVVFSIVIVTAVGIGLTTNPEIYKANNIYPLEFSEIGNTKIENLQLNNIRIIEEKIIDKDLSAFIFTDWIRYNLRVPKTEPKLREKYTREVVYFF